jgi:FtsX-like permease family protein/MacB-like protein
MAALHFLRQAANDARANTLRSLLSALSLFVAVLSVTAIYTISSVTGDVLLAQHEQAHGRAITEQVTLPAAATQWRGSAYLGAQLAAVAGQGHGHYALTAEIPSALQWQNQEADITITLTDGRLDEIRRLPLLSGSWYPEAGTASQAVVVNAAAAHELGALRQFALRMDPARAAVPAHVVGVIADGSSAAAYYMSMRSAVTWDPAILHDIPCTLLLQAAGVAEPVLRGALRTVLISAAVDLSTVEISRADTTADLAKSISDSRRGFLIVASATLLVSVLGLLNVGLASVRERRREVAIRRATGASRSRVFALVCASACIGGVAAAAAALLVGVVGVDIVLPHYVDAASAIKLPHFPWAAGALGLLVGLAASLLGAAAPAAAAARANLSDLLR